MKNGFQSTSDEFMNEIQQMIDNEFCSSSKQIRDGFESGQTAIIEELSGVLNQIYKNYCTLQQEGMTGMLKWIYFSFLRSSMVDEHSAYQIDFYDERDCYTSLECCGEWDFSYVFSHFYRIKRKVEVEFKKQSKVKAYEADSFLYSLYEQFHEIAAEFLPALLKNSLIANQEMGDVIGIKEGELFDNTELIGYWGK